MELFFELSINILASILLLGFGFLHGKHRERRLHEGKNLANYHKFCHRHSGDKIPDENILSKEEYKKALAENLEPCHPFCKKIRFPTGRGLKPWTRFTISMAWYSSAGFAGGRKVSATTWN